MWHRAKIETLNITTETPGVLAKAGCRVSIISGHPFQIRSKVEEVYVEGERV